MKDIDGIYVKCGYVVITIYPHFVYKSSYEKWTRDLHI